MKQTLNMIDRAVIDVAAVKNRMVLVRGEPVLLDSDVAALYGVETKHVNQAIRNNPGKFPLGYFFELNDDEVASLRSKILTLEGGCGKGKHSKHGYRALAECGPYMPKICFGQAYHEGKSLQIMGRRTLGRSRAE